MAFWVMGAHTEIRLAVQTKHAAAQKLARAQKDLLLETLHVDLDEIGLRDQPFSQQAVQPPNWHLAGLLSIFHVVPAGPLPIHRAGGWIGRIEIERLLAVDIAYPPPLIVALKPALTPLRH